MMHAKYLGLIGAAVMAVTLAGCTSFTPVYGDRAQQWIASARFIFAAPSNRLEQIVLKRLALAFPAQGSVGDPTLSVSVVRSSPSAGISNAITAGRPQGVRVEATVTIRRADGQAISFTRFADTTYQGEKLKPTDYNSEIGAEEVAANAVAESLRLAILAGYKP